jgi:hypothetical protein
MEAFINILKQYKKMTSQSFDNILEVLLSVGEERMVELMNQCLAEKKKIVSDDLTYTIPEGKSPYGLEDI